jgi:hypothetical protein
MVKRIERRLIILIREVRLVAWDLGGKNYNIVVKIPLAPQITNNYNYSIFVVIQKATADNSANGIAIVLAIAFPELFAWKTPSFCELKMDWAEEITNFYSVGTLEILRTLGTIIFKLKQKNICPLFTFHDQLSTYFCVFMSLYIGSLKVFEVA